MNRDDLLRLAKAAGLGNQASIVTSAARDFVRLTPTPTEEHRQPLGTSRLGGVPDLDPEQVWPTWERGPLGFVAQLELAAIAPCLPGWSLPNDGWLSFFYNPDQDTWGFDPNDASGFRVLYTPARATLRRIQPPAELSDQGRFQACDLGFGPDLSLPSRESDAFNQVGLSALPEAPFEDLMEELWGEHGWGSRTKLFGYADEIQNPMAEECALVTGGVYCGDGSSAQDPRTPTLKATARDWELLLQVSSHEESSMMWGDMGMIYYWLRTQDRQVGRFDRGWLILQCG